MRKRIVGRCVFALCLLFSLSSFAAQFSAEIEAKIKGDGSASSTTSTQSETSSTSKTDDNSFLSEDKKKYDEQHVPMWLGIGPQLGLGPNVLLPPSNANNMGTSEIAPFKKGGAGFSGTGGAVVYTRWLQGRLGLSVGIMAERNQVRTTMNINGTDSNMFIYKYSVGRIPILVRWHKLKENKRWSLGLGPEFVVGLQSTQGTIRSEEVLQTKLRVEPENDFLVALVLGWAAKYDNWVIGLDLKFTYNITGTRQYDERITEATSGFRVVASHSLDARLIIGLMYEIGIGKNRGDK